MCYLRTFLYAQAILVCLIYVTKLIINAGNFAHNLRCTLKLSACLVGHDVNFVVGSSFDGFAKLAHRVCHTIRFDSGLFSISFSGTEVHTKSFSPCQSVTFGGSPTDHFCGGKAVKPCSRVSLLDYSASSDCIFTPERGNGEAPLVTKRGFTVSTDIKI